VSLPVPKLRRLAVARRRPVTRLLGRLPDRTIGDLLTFHDGGGHRDILDAALANREERSLAAGDPAYLSDRYGQIELQRMRRGGDAGRREEFVDPVDSALMAAIEAITGPCYRSRIATLRRGGAIPRHVDDPGQLRVISLLRGSHAFRLFDRSGQRSVPMAPGELWFVNTAWEHEVGNYARTDRVALLLNLFELPGACDA